MNTDLRTRAEELLVKSDQAFRAVPVEDVQALIHELSVYEVELEIQNEELRRAQAEILAANNRIRAIYDLAPVGHLTLNSRGVIMAANQAALALIGRDHATLLKTTFYSLLLREDQKLFHSDFTACRSGGAQRSCQIRMNKPDGSIAFVEVRMVALKSGADLPLFLVCLVDIGKAKELELSLQKAKELAEHASHMKSQFLANMSHEIRTPLSAVIGFADLLIAPDILDDERAEFALAIHRNGDQLLQLINDILDLSRIEIGSINCTKREIVTASLLNDIKVTLELKAREKGIAFSILDEGLPARLFTDPIRIKQILYNLVGNALKFTKHGGTITVTGRMDSKLHFFSFSVRDTGIGIAQRNHRDLFTPFFQVEQGGASFGGAGLGLALSQKLARSLGGDLWLETSELGSGSVFVLTLPAEEPPPHVKSSTTAAARANLQNWRILLAEDNQYIAMICDMLLKKQGATVDIARNGREAVEMALSTEYDAILMDIRMPVMNGLDATRELRKRGYKKAIIALTAHALNEERDASLAAGCNAHLSKPVSIDQLVACLQEWGRA